MNRFGVLAMLALGGRMASAQEARAVTPSWDSRSWLAPNDTFALALSDGLASARLAVWIGATDVTALLSVDHDTLRYGASGIGLPLGESVITVYRMNDRQEWVVVGTVPLQVRYRAGVDTAEVKRDLMLSSNGELATGPEASLNRRAFRDVALATTLGTTHVWPGWSVKSRANIVGGTNRQDALQFAQRPLDAPKLDLGEYQVNTERGLTSLSLGQLTFGSNRHLINEFASRGASVSTRVGQRATVSLAAFNGSQAVGFSNPTGIATPNHRILAGSAGASLPGGMRVDGTLMDGSILPVPGFNRGAITDAETSEGGGVRLQTVDPGQRVRFDAGFSHSKSDFLPDSALGGSLRLAGLTRAARNAWYVDVSADLLRGATVGTHPLNLAVTARAERVDPLYRSVGVSLSPDLATRAIALQGTIGAVALHASVTRLRDNLDRIASLLTTSTNASSFGLAMPLTGVSTWLPTVTVGLDRTSQVGAGVPPNSGFSPTHVPDQRNAIGSVTLQWTGPLWHADLQFNNSDQDNRQAGRERADLLSVTRALTVGITPVESFAFSMDLGYDGGHNREFDQRTRTRRGSVSMQWRPYQSTTLNTTLTQTNATDAAARSVNRDTRVELQQRLPVGLLTRRTSASQAFLRYARTMQSSSGPLADPLSLRVWSVSTGVTLPIF